MRIGVFLLAARFPGQSEGEVLAATVEAAVAAERAGFDDVWLAEHHFMSYGVCPSAATLAAYVLGRTRRVVVGTAVSVLSTQHPVALAEQAALLDQVSAGRFWLGVGRGGPWIDLEVFGTGLARYESGFAEGVDLLLAALTSQRVSGTGPAFTFRDVAMVPRPRTSPRPPVVVAATSAATAELAAARRLPMLLGMHIGDDGKRELIAHYQAAAAGHRRQAGGHIAAVVAHVADTSATAQRVLRRELPRWLGPGLAGYVPVDGRARQARDPDAYADLLCRIHPVGSAADCVRIMTTTALRTGIRHLVLMVEGAGDPARVRENIARLGAEVLPQVRRQVSSRPAPGAG
ncbi:MAG TPA: LLM class flavin-dependent oxidoreductase [Streptosporangiaceae bacterium]|nr:LLM class flavin-dependent oxidoreductase [Streptosporangiaceae bacterium]